MRKAMRCRGLAAAAGLDPDAKIPREGMRPIPTWCTFRDAARAERNAQEAAALGLALTEQAEQYRESPLTVLGAHEASTVAQMRNCTKVGNVAAGVICAAGHLGYAQPVGGVIAYEGQISISGVGFDIACGNMPVQLDVRHDEIADRVPDIAREIAKAVSFGATVRNRLPSARTSS